MNSRTKQTVDRYVLRLMLYSLVLALAARCVSIAYTGVSSDVECMNTALPTVLGILRKLLSNGYIAVIYGAAAVSAYENGRTRISAFLASSAVLLVYNATAYLYDLASGALVGREVYVLLYVLATFAVDVILFGAVSVICRICERKKSKPYSASTASVLAVLIVNLIYEGYSIVSFLIEYDFIVYPEEIASMIAEVGGVFAYSFVLPVVIGHAVIRIGQIRKDNIK